MDSRNNFELLKLHFEEFKYRHELFWQLFFRFALAILFLLALPFAYPTTVAQFKAFVIFLPIAADIVTVFSFWLLMAEYRRLATVRQQFNDLRPDGHKQYPLSTKTSFDRLLGRPVGQVVAKAFLWCFLLLSALEALFIWLAA